MANLSLPDVRHSDASHCKGTRRLRGLALRHTDLWFSQIDRRAIIELGAARAWPCLSAFVPVPARTDERVRTFDAVFDQVASLLRSTLPNRKASSILRSVGAVLAAPQSWRPSSRSLAIYSSEDTFAVVATDLRLKPGVGLAPRFATRPLLDGVARAPRAAGRTIRNPAMGPFLTKIDEVLRAANEGRVRELFISDSAEERGRFDPTTGVVRSARRPGPADDDLLDLAAVKTLESGGSAYSVDARRFAGHPTGYVAVPGTA